MNPTLNAALYFAAPLLTDALKAALIGLAVAGVRLVNKWSKQTAHGTLDALAKRFVRAAEMKFSDGTVRYDWALDALKKAAPKFPVDALSAALEAAVNELSLEQQKASIAIPVVPAGEPPLIASVKSIS